MSDSFKSGVANIPVGVVEFPVGFEDIGFDPVSVQVSVRQPSADEDIVSAYVIGEVTRTGFSIALSSPVSFDGYLLDWTIFSDGVVPSPVAGDTLCVDYSVLKKEVSHFLGYDAEALTETQLDEVDMYIQSGIRQFYYPPKMNGVDEHFEWSFLRMDGSVNTAVGICGYALPDGFGRIAGQLVFSDKGIRNSIPVIPYGDIRRFIDNMGERGRPRFASVISTREFGNRGQGKKLLLYPIPDKAYTLSFVGDGDNGKLDPITRPFPLGGVMYSELIIESCLAIAEQRANDEVGLHTQQFNNMLVSTIARDRKSSAQSFGDFGSQERMWD